MMHPVPVKRSVRVAERVREEIARALARDLADPRFSHAVVTRVEMPDDLGVARVWVRIAAGGDDDASRTRLLSGLSSARGKLRKQVGRAVGLRRAPELRFHYDEGQDASVRIEEILQEIERERDRGRE